MGNENDSNTITDLTEEKEKEEEYFDDISSIADNKKSNKKKINIEQNLLISQMKSDPFSEYVVIRELGRGSLL